MSAGKAREKAKANPKVKAREQADSNSWLKWMTSSTTARSMKDKDNLKEKAEALARAKVADKIRVEHMDKS